MKKTILIASLALIPFALQAQEETEKERRGPRGDRAPRELPAEVIAKFDTDGDGKLNEEERKAAREARRAEFEKRRAEMLEKFDTDKDGKLSQEERKAAMLARFDKDGDGELSDAEKEEARKAAPPRGRGEGREGRAPRGEGKGGEGRGPRKEQD
ncbi:EF-hand domain-containing protein [Roseibacillus ishigakijimensis]|uniref:EF-hand domain-containing protein n=1 Tax=Roseibacillus ishigakijimensis TaxID=454146 RepID=A0A934VLR8_9BACT|nr:EF-hand domain-containing protein [Roseibacillus ishigakijimensis]MBK1833371.1 EF-hand domain-containing protein [Roseibacillus ishigakijimensis]